LTFAKSFANQAEAQEGGVYAMYKVTANTNKLYYIGKAKDFSKRFGTHRNSAASLA
jgi:predicted GIY-YIG superfamily endonuclease